MQALIDQAIERTGRLDILVNNAGVLVPGPITSVSQEDWSRMFRVNVDSVFFGCRSANQGGGAIINIASISRMRGSYGLAAYNAAKGAVVNLTRSLGLEYASNNIRINAICPGSIATEMNDVAVQFPDWASAWLKAIPAKRFGEPQALTGLAVLLASEDATFMNGAHSGRWRQLGRRWPADLDKDAARNWNDRLTAVFGARGSVA